MVIRFLQQTFLLKQRKKASKNTFSCSKLFTMMNWSIKKVFIFPWLFKLFFPLLGRVVSWSERGLEEGSVIDKTPCREGKVTELWTCLPNVNTDSNFLTLFEEMAIHIVDVSCEATNPNHHAFCYVRQFEPARGQDPECVEQGVDLEGGQENPFPICWWEEQGTHDWHGHWRTTWESIRWGDLF